MNINKSERFPLFAQKFSFYSEFYKALCYFVQMDASTIAAQKVDNSPRMEPMLSSSSTPLIEHVSTPLVEKPLDDFLQSKSNIEPTCLLEIIYLKVQNL